KQENAKFCWNVGISCSLEFFLIRCRVGCAGHGSRLARRGIADASVEGLLAFRELANVATIRPLSAQTAPLAAVLEGDTHEEAETKAALRRQHLAGGPLYGGGCRSRWRTEPTGGSCSPTGRRRDALGR